MRRIKSTGPCCALRGLGWSIVDMKIPPQFTRGRSGTDQRIGNLVVQKLKLSLDRYMLLENWLKRTIETQWSIVVS